MKALNKDKSIVKPLRICTGIKTISIGRGVEVSGWSPHRG